MENSSYKLNNIENRSTTTWAKRKIIKNDDLVNLEKLISLDNVVDDAINDFIKVQGAKCKCQGWCQHGCTGSCSYNCTTYCDHFLTLVIDDPDFGK